jgi:hypothetical protein
MMKRAIIPIELPQGVQQFEVELQEPGTVHSFLMGYRKKKTLLAMPDTPDGQQVVEEVPTIMVEVDPTTAPRRRKFVVLATGQVAEASALKFIGTTMSQANGGALYHLFEEFDYEFGSPVHAEALRKAADAI